MSIMKTHTLVHWSNLQTFELSL